jgi:hypothetical protein
VAAAHATPVPNVGKSLLDESAQIFLGSHNSGIYYRALIREMMSRSARMWVHCSLCMELGSLGLRLHITSCGRLVCLGCLPSLRDVRCTACRGPCSRTVPLDSTAPPNVLGLFKDGPKQMRSVFKNVAWQEGQKVAIAEHTDGRLRELALLEEQQVEEMGQLEALQERRRAQLWAVEREIVKARAAWGMAGFESA